ncbi:DgyrCDS3067 [Dimorphilus gyrociliatus]|uniref:DgyrCDS3067 n=1 Tax=Dimorphilus gyrociliatus TaxID=2664684 RepID=A0A7I8VC35_9ANNE|nr:DgyrCDS3067 [Dimorphilus gyrociliatus]
MSRPGNEKFLNQSYNKLKKSLKQPNELFVDQKFPMTSILRSSNQRIEWKRPKDISSNPRIFVDNGVISVKQGELGNCWFMSALVCLVRHKDLLKKVMPHLEIQEWNAKKPETYKGIFKFSFCRLGKWMDVVIDDRLPTRNNGLIYSRSNNKNEFFSSLVEKAYAKFHGGYSAIESGTLSESFSHLTGGNTKTITLSEVIRGNNNDEVFYELKKAFKSKCLVTASREAIQHAYAVIAVKEVPLMKRSRKKYKNSKKLKMIYLHNPWGDGNRHRDSGLTFSDWDALNKSWRKKNQKVNDNGEYWVLFDLFVQRFRSIAICTIKSSKKEQVFHSSWNRKSNTVGGCVNSRESFPFNPQFLLNVKREEETIECFLTQDHERSGRKPLLSMNTTVVKAEVNRNCKFHSLRNLKVINDGSKFTNLETTFNEYTLKKGTYILVPSTYERGREGKFSLKIIGNVQVKELLRDTPKSKLSFPLSLFQSSKGFSVVTSIKINHIDFKESKDNEKYTVKFRCENKTILCDYSENEGISVVFYRKKEDVPITLEIYSKGLLGQKQLGKAFFNKNLESIANQVFTEPIEGSRVGTIRLIVNQSTNLNAL